MKTTWKKTKRLLGIVLCICLVLQYVPTTAFAADAIEAASTDGVTNAKTWGEYTENVSNDTATYTYTYADFSPFSDGSLGTEDNPYEIETPEQLAGLAALVNAYDGSTRELTGINNSKAVARDFSDLYIKLTANIDISGHDWIPIGTYDTTTKVFKGHFDGDGHIVSGLTIGTETTANTTYAYAGLFGYMSAGSVKNLAVSGTVNVSCKNALVAGVVGYAIEITIENCSSAVNVTASTSATGSNAYAGGITAYASKATITNCHNTGTVTATTYAGGIAASARNATIANCSNMSTVTATSIAGGITAYALGATITNCCSTSTVSGEAAGGFAGSVAATTITNCYSVGSVSGTTAGGFAGKVGSMVTINNCFWCTTNDLRASKGLGDYTTGSPMQLALSQMQAAENETDSSWEMIDILEKAGSLVDALNKYVNDNSNSTVTLMPWHIHDQGTPVLGKEEIKTAPNSDGVTHTASCTGCTYSKTAEHTGGTATCTAQAACDICGASYGGVDSYNHTGPYTPEFNWPEKTDELYMYVSLHCVCGVETDYAYVYSDSFVVESETAATDCQNPGSVTYSVTVTLNKQKYTETKTYTVLSENHVGSWVNGFCSDCAGYEAAVWNEEKSVYEISNAGQLYWYAQYLNTTNAEIYAELTDDIVIPENAPNWEPINASYVYFNGNFHTISGLKCIGDENMTYVGLFGIEGWWYDISNLQSRVATLRAAAMLALWLPV